MNYKLRVAESRVVRARTQRQMLTEIQEIVGEDLTLLSANFSYYPESDESFEAAITFE